MPTLLAMPTTPSPPTMPTTIALSAPQQKLIGRPAGGPDVGGAGGAGVVNAGVLCGPPPSRVNARNNMSEPTKPHQPEKAGHKKMN